MRPIVNANLGAAAELIAAGDLVRRGYEVFRAVTPHCSCDLVILKDGLIQRVEVRSGTWVSDEIVRYNYKPLDVGRSDLIAIVVDHEVFYQVAPTYEEMTGRGSMHVKVR